MYKFFNLIIYLSFSTFFQTVAAQAIFDTHSIVQAITVNNDSTTTKCFAFLEEKNHRQRNDLWYASYFRNQIIKTQGSHIGRMLHGNYKVFDRQMQLREEGNYINGLQMGVWKYWDNGALAKTIQWRNGRMDGRTLVFDSSGSIVLESNYRKNLLDGWQNTFENGELTSRVKYRNGVEIPARVKVKKDSLARNNNTETKEKPKQTIVDQIKPQSVQEKNKSRTRKPKRKKRIQSSSIDEKKSENNIQDEEVNTGKIQLFITDDSSQLPLKQVSIKISQFNRSANDEKFRYFGYSDEDGFYQLEIDTADIVLFITHKGYPPRQMRIYQKDKRAVYHIGLSLKKSCGKLTGQVQPASKNIALQGVKVQIKSENGRLVETAYSNTQGYFSACLPCGAKYVVHIQHDGYEETKETVYLAVNCMDAQQNIVAYLPSMERKKALSVPDQTELFFVESPAKRAGGNRQNSDSGGKTVAYQGRDIFKVIAGTFSQKSNANKRLEEVRSAGFSEAGIIQIQDSGYFAVCLGSLSSRGAAEALRNQFKSATHLEAYVRDE